MPNNPNAAANLKPAKKGEVRNPHGRPKGSKNLATIVKELENDDFDWQHVPTKQKEAAAMIGSPWKAIVFTAIAKAYEGDVRAMDWLRKSGYGDKLDITTDGEPIQALVTFVEGKDATSRSKTTT